MDQEPVIDHDEILHAVRDIVPPQLRPRVGIVRRKNYFAIHLDGMRHRVLCRIYDNPVRRRLGLYNLHNVETKVRLQELRDLYFYAGDIKARAKKYD